MVRAVRVFKRSGSSNAGSFRAKAYDSFVGKRKQFGKRSLAKKVNILAKKCKDADEKKFFDTALGFAPSNALSIPATGQLSLIPQNDTQSGRDGRKAVVSSIYVHGEVEITGGTLTRSDYGCIYVVLDKQANGAAATVANADTGIFTTADIATANRTLANVDRFQILGKIPLGYDKGMNQLVNPGSTPEGYFVSFVF